MDSRRDQKCAQPPSKQQQSCLDYAHLLMLPPADKGEAIPADTEPTSPERSVP